MRHSDECMQRDAHDAACMHPRGLALLVQRGCLNITSADTGDMQARTQVTLSKPGYAPMLRVHMHQHSTGRDMCAVHEDTCAVKWHMDTTVKRQQRPWRKRGCGPSGALAVGRRGCGEQRRAVSVRQTQRLHY